jgi:hypothetical protein
MSNASHSSVVVIWPELVWPELVWPEAELLVVKLLNKEVSATPTWDDGVDFFKISSRNTRRWNLQVVIIIIIIKVHVTYFKDWICCSCSCLHDSEKKKNWIGNIYMCSGHVKITYIVMIRERERLFSSIYSSIFLILLTAFAVLNSDNTCSQHSPAHLKIKKYYLLNHRLLLWISIPTSSSWLTPPHCVHRSGETPKNVH